MPNAGGWRSPGASVQARELARYLHAEVMATIEAMAQLSPYIPALPRRPINGERSKR